MCSVSLNDATLSLGRKGGHDMFFLEIGGNGGHPYYGPDFVPSAGGNGRQEPQLFPLLSQCKRLISKLMVD